MRKVSEIKKGAKEFVKRWIGRGKEDEDDQKYWEDLLEIVFGISKSRDEIEVQRKVKFGGTVKKIDVYVKSSKVVIEQKSHNVNLDKPEEQSDGAILTPLEQGIRYFEKMDKPDSGRYVIACNFQEFRIWDSYKKNADIRIISLEELPKRWKDLLFLIEPYNDVPVQKDPKREKNVSSTASEYVKDLYNALLTVNKTDTKESLQSLNVFCVRIVFCLFAEDAGLFDDAQFSVFLEKYSAKELNEKFTALFKWLDTNEKEREDNYLLVDEKIRTFPYVNGGLFKFTKDYKTPIINEEVRSQLLRAWNLTVKGSKDKEKFSWDEISPTNFGCIFESTVAKDVRDSGGMHYTTPANIHRVIDPLFMNDLKAELDTILCMPFETKKDKDIQYGMLESYRKKLASLRFFDPACGSGNFLTEVYKLLRELELKAITQEFNLNYYTRTETTDPCMVHINQFFGIEIDHFAASVARASMWIAECQMLQETEKVLRWELDPLPLEKNNNILCGDALLTDWENLVKRRATSPTYIISNPPFQGYSKMTRGQKSSLNCAMPSKIGNKKVWRNQGKMDFVCAWYAKAAKYMSEKKNVKCALVSTNSITQGEQVALLWKPLVQYYNFHISFAWKTFRWNNEADDMAQVHCVIIGFGKHKKGEKCYIYQEGSPMKEVDNINGYLMGVEDFFIESRTEPLGKVAPMVYGNKPVEGGNLIMSAEEYKALISEEPLADQYVRVLMGAREFLHNEERYCLWFTKEPSADELERMPLVKKRIKATEEFREKSKKAATVELADEAYRFMEVRQPSKKYVLVPRHSSENRKYIPMGFVDPSIICSDANHIIPSPSLWLFGILQSRIHTAWVKYVCGRLKSDYRYSANIVYNNFPWKDLDDDQKAAIEITAQEILEARKADGSSLASQYDLLKGRLSKAHKENDKVVAKAYDIDLNMSDEEIAIELMRRSVKLAKSKEKKKRKRKKFVIQQVEKKHEETHVMGNLPFVEQEVEQNIDE